MSVFVHDVKSSSENKVIINGDRGIWGRRGMEFNHRIVTFVSALLSYSKTCHGRLHTEQDKFSYIKQMLPCPSLGYPYQPLRNQC